MEKLKVGVIGCGWVSNGHIQGWRKVREAEVISVCDLNVKAAASMAEKWNIKEYYGDFEELVETSQVDVVDICTPPQTHSRFMVRAMENGINALTEKPMTMTTEDGQKIVDAKNRTGLKAGVVHNWLYEPTIIEAVKMVKQGMLGGIINVEVEALNTKFDPMTSNETHWCHGLVGGRISEMLPHPIYLIKKFLGPDLRLRAVQRTKVGDYPWMRSDEMCATFSVGKNIGRAYASFNSPRDTIFVNIYGKEAYLKTEIINATLNIFPKRENRRISKGFDSLRQAAQLTGSTLSNVFKIATNNWNSGVDTIIRLFAQSILTDTEPPVSVEEGVEVIRVLEQVADSIDKAEKE